MPTLRIKEVRIPELHLPEMSRDDIAKAIGDVTKDLRNLDLPDASDIARELSKVDVPAAIESITSGRRGGRMSRAPLVLGGIVVLGIVTVALAMSPMFRPKLEQMARRAREEFEARRDAATEREATERDMWTSLDSTTTTPRQDPIESPVTA